MKKIFLVVFILITSSSVIAKAESNNVVADFLNPNSYDAYKASPDGQFISYTYFDGDQLHYNVKHIESDNDITVIIDDIDGSYNASDYYWIDSNDILVEYYSTSDREYKIVNLRLEIEADGSVGYTIRELLEEFNVFDPLPEIENTAIFVKYEKDGASNLFKANIDASPIYKNLRASNRINRGTENAYGWLINKRGLITVAAKTVDGKNKILYRKEGSKRWEAVLELPEESNVKPVLLEENKQSLLLTMKENGSYHLKRFSIVEKDLSKSLHKFNSKDITGFLVGPDKQSLIGSVGVVDGQYAYEYIDLYRKKLIGRIGEHLPDKRISVISYDLNKSIYTVFASAVDDSGNYYLYNDNESTLIHLNNKIPSIKDYKLEKSLLLKSKSSDGVEVESYLTPSVRAGKSPLIVYPHGGPVAIRDLREFDRAVHMLSQLGYAVLQVNYRGSAGYGEEFLKSAQRQWGRLIEDDIKNATLEAFKTNVVNEEQVCIFGTSYGGYSALMSIINYPELYDCAISYAGVTDLTLLHNEYVVQHNEDLKKFYEEYVGNPDTDFEDLTEHSPVYRVKDITKPVFLGQGMKDDVVDMEHFFRLREVLMLLDKEVETSFFTDEKHDLKYIRNKTYFFNKMHNFIGKHLD